MNCRHCNTYLKHVMVNLGSMPPSNAYVEEPGKPQRCYPLKVFVCDHCWLVQTADYVTSRELFSNNYAYFSSVSSGWLKHAKDYVDMITERLRLKNNSFVVEIGSNDGYLLRNFMAMEVRCLGVEPTISTARVAIRQLIPTVCKFFTAHEANLIAKEHNKAELIIGNNVYAHVPDINDFTRGMKVLLKAGGTITLEFPHLLKLMQNMQFDTIYHEHFSYLSLFTVMQIFAKSGLRVFDVEELKTHGGSIRVYGCHDNDKRLASWSVGKMLEEEKTFGLQDLKIYNSFQGKTIKIARDFKKFLLEQKAKGLKVAAIGAAAKGNTLLNYAKVNRSLIDFVCDSTPAKQGKYLPGSLIPIKPMSELAMKQPDWIVIFPWNVADEIIDEARAAGWNRYGVAVAIPKLKLYARWKYVGTPDNKSA